MKKIIILTFFFVLLGFNSKISAEVSIIEGGANYHAFKLISVEEMWNAGFTGEGVNIAVIDTGLEFEAGKAKHIDYNINKIVQYDCKKECVKVTEFKPSDNHGTLVTGLIAAQHDGKGMKGIAPNAKIYSFATDSYASADDLRKSLTIIYEHNKNATSKDKISIVNISSHYAFANDETTELLQKIYNEQGVLFVAAGGNISDQSLIVAYPARLDFVIGVANVDTDGSRHEDSTMGVGLNIAAPGVDVWTTDMGNSYRSVRGT